MRSHRSLRTILITDLVGSTQRVSELGDRAWGTLLKRHHNIVRQAFRRWGAGEVSESGDGFLAILDSPARGIVCAAEIRDATHSLGLNVRCGLHMGEVEHDRSGSVGGIGVHIGARVAAHAEAGEILVSQAVRDTEQGSGFSFDDRGLFELKGVGGDWRLFRVRAVPAHASSLPPGRGERIAAVLRRRRGSVLVASAALLALLIAVTLRGRIGEQTHLTVAGNAISHDQVTFLGNVRKGALSPDGKTMAYVAFSPTEDDRLFVRDLSGGDPVEIYHDESIYNVRWSPTGEELLVGASSDREGRSRLVRLPRLGGPREEFPSARWFAWSPDARAFAFAYYEPDFLFIRDLTSSRIDSIAVPDDYDVLLDLDWSPAGDRLSMILHEEPSRYDLWSIDRSGEPARRIVQDSVPLFNTRWSRDGGAIYYSRTVDPGSTDLLKVELSTAGDARSQPILIANLGRAVSFEMFAEDRGVSYIGAHGHSNLSLISFPDSGTSVITPLTTGTAYDTDPALSPDGHRVAFTRRAGDEQNIHLLDLDARSSRQITFLEGPSCCPAWSPDGREIAFFSSTGGEPRVWKIGSDGGTPIPLSLVTMTDPLTVQWAPGAEILVQSGWNPTAITFLDPETGKSRPLPANAGRQLMFRPRFSPDGTRLAGTGHRAILIESLLDGSFRTLETSLAPTVVTWSADGEWIYAFEGDSSAIMRYSISGPEMEMVLKVDCEFVETASSDGKHFICTSYKPLLDLWLARNLPASARAAAGDLN